MLFEEHGDNDAFKRNRPHGVEVLGQMMSRSPEQVIERFLVLLAQSAAVL
jgi:hypothetical protein